MSRLTIFQVAIPIILLIIGILAKSLSRRDGDESSKWNDWAVGTTTLLMMFSVLLNDIRYSINNNIGYDDILIMFFISWIAVFDIRFNIP